MYGRRERRQAAGASCYASSCFKSHSRLSRRADCNSSNPASRYLAWGCVPPASVKFGDELALMCDLPLSQAVPGEQPNATAVPPRHDAKAVVLDLVKPSRPGRRLGGWSGEAGINGIGPGNGYAYAVALRL
jgi:hypothetical protein